MAPKWPIMTPMQLQAGPKRPQVTPRMTHLVVKWRFPFLVLKGFSPYQADLLQKTTFLEGPPKTAGLDASWAPLGALLRPSWAPLGRLLGAS